MKTIIVYSVIGFGLIVLGFVLALCRAAALGDRRMGRMRDEQIKEFARICDVRHWLRDKTHISLKGACVPKPWSDDQIKAFILEQEAKEVRCNCHACEEARWKAYAAANP